MTCLDDYRFAMLVAFDDVPDGELMDVLDAGGSDFVSFVIDHGLGPLWYERTMRSEFYQSRVTAEALFFAQDRALSEIDAVLEAAGIEYAVIKGAANRLRLYEIPAVRACHDLDLLVRAGDRIRAAGILLESGYEACPDSDSISRELVLSRGNVDIDLHWSLLREGRLRKNCTKAMLGRRRRIRNIWTLNVEDELFLVLVHAAFAKHLSAWGMGLHRVNDIVRLLQRQSIDWQRVRTMLDDNGVRTAAWATLQWVQLLTAQQRVSGLHEKLSQLCPGVLRSHWLRFWLRNNLPERLSHARWMRLAIFSVFLHDQFGDVLRAFEGRRRAISRSQSDLDVFSELLDQ